ncbi:high mobility group box domain-containing protein [Mycena capillaripes]|nr:high mobility group box domain-containing protein [Mycena capillaripes]
MSSFDFIGVSFAPSAAFTSYDAHAGGDEGTHWGADGGGSTSARGARARHRASPSYIPRPPNAFILFRSSFIRSQNVPEKVEGNHRHLSKIIGKYWHALPPSERARWEDKARAAQAEHRRRYPDWRFRPGNGKVCVCLCVCLSFVLSFFLSFVRSFSPCLALPCLISLSFLSPRPRVGGVCVW